jgi:hypothetical protein
VKGTEVTLEAPAEIRQHGGILKFAGWVISGKQEAQSKITLKIEEAIKAIAYYEREELIPDSRAKPVNVSVSASAKQLCIQNFTHELTISWEVTDGQRPITVRAEITYPDKHVERIEFKPIEGSQAFPVSSPNGGTLKVRVIAKDSGNATSSAESIVELKECGKRSD